MFQRLKQRIKDFLKYHFYILKVGNKFSPAVQIAQRHLFNYYRDLAEPGQGSRIERHGIQRFTQLKKTGCWFSCLP